MNYSQKQLVLEFLQFETDLDLINWNINSIPIWELIRFKVFNNINNQLVNKSFFKVKQKSKESILRSLLSFIQYCNSNPLRYIKELEYLVINHPRRRLINGVYLDVYTDTFLSELDKNYIVIEGYSDFSHHKPTSTKDLYYFDFVDFPNLVLSKLSKFYKLDKITKCKVLEIEQKIKEIWGLPNINILDEVKKNILRHKFLYPKHKRTLLKLKPNKIVCVVSYYYNAQIITQVAKELNIPVIELQHGTVGKYHIGYNYPSNIIAKTFPDYFFSWGDFWVENVRLPIPDNNILKIGFPYIDLHKKNDNKVKSNIILVLSQGRDDIAELTSKLSELLLDYRFIFKAHPREYGTIGNRYPTLAENKNIEIIENNNTLLYDLFCTSKYVIGVNSTAIIESLAFKCNVIIAKYAGWEYFEYLLGSEHIYISDSADDIYSYIMNGNIKTRNNNISDYFFRDGAKERLLETIKDIR